MSDIRNWDAFKRGRWNWNEFGYERYLTRGCAFGDVDALIESGGRHLFVECKHWGDNDNPLPNPSEPPLGIPKGQWMSLHRLAHKQDIDVWLFYGDGERNIPNYLVEVGVDEHHVSPLVNLSLEHRREWYSRRIGLWQAEADGRLFMPDGPRGNTITGSLLKGVFQ